MSEKKKKNPHAQALARLSNLVWSEKRAAAARINGLAGGRPMTLRHQHRARHVGEVPLRPKAWTRTDECGCGAWREARIWPDGTVSYGKWERSIR